jgi:ribosome-associated protein
MEDIIGNVDTLQIARQLATLALEKQATDLVILDLTGLVPYCDYFVLCNGRSRRQVRAIANAVQVGMKKGQSLSPASVEGAESCRWVLVDYGDVVLHVFDEKLRDFYDLDTLWTDAPRVEAPQVAELSTAAV